MYYQLQSSLLGLKAVSGTSYRHEKLQCMWEVSVWFMVVRHFHTLHAQSVNNVSSWLGPILFTDTISCFGSFQHVIKCILFVLFIFFVHFTSESYLLFCKVVISLTSTAEYKLDMSGNKLLKKICELNWDDVRGVWSL